MSVSRICYFLILSVMCCHVALAQSDRQLSVILKNGAIFPPGRWIPASLVAKNASSADVDGRITTELQTATGAYELAYPLKVPARSIVEAEMMVNLREPARLLKPTDKQQPVATFFWRSADNAEVAREPVYAAADSQGVGNQTDATGISGVQVVHLTANYVDDEMADPSDLPTILGENSAFRYSQTSMQPSRMSRRSIALDASRIIVLEQSAVNLLDPAQREAILQHIRGGATLLVIATDASIAGTWIGGYLPMDIVGERESAVIESQQYGVVALRQAVLHRVSQARADATVTLSTTENTLAAYRNVGFGRVAMMGLPVNSIQQTDQIATTIWSDLIGVNRPAFHDPSANRTNDISQDGQQDQPLIGMLPSVVGATAPPWKTAALISLIYTGAVAVVLLVIGAKYRPLAIVGCVGGGVLLAGAVLGMNSIKSIDQPLMLARLTVVDIDKHAVRRNEIATFFGQQRDADIDFSVPANALPTALVTAGSTPPTLRMYPFSIKGVSSSTGTYSSVWNIQSQSQVDQPNQVTLSFGPDGAKLNVDPNTASTFAAARLLYGASVFPLGDLQSGTQVISIPSRNNVGEWSDSGKMIADEQSKLQTEILIRAETRRDPTAGLLRRSGEPKLVGFASQIESQIKVDEPVDQRGQTLVRSTVSIQASPVGSEVRIDPGFTQIRKEASPSLPYRELGDYWSDSTPGGPWLLAIAAPLEIGRLNPKQLTLDLNLQAAGYDFVVQRGQVSGGKAREMPNGETILKWENQDGQKRATVDLTPNDIDANGWVWIRISAVQLPASESLLGSLSGGQVTSVATWRILQFNATLQGTIAGAPQSAVKTWTNESETRRVPPATKTPEKPVKKPPSKPAAKPK